MMLLKVLNRTEVIERLHKRRESRFLFPHRAKDVSISQVSESDIPPS
jgi:hypothetical protein